MDKPKAIMDKDTKKWLNSHTTFYLGVSVDEIMELAGQLETERELTHEFATKLALCQEELEQYKAAALLADPDVMQELEAHGSDIKGVPV